MALLKTLEVPGRNLKDDVFAEYVKRLRAGTAYWEFIGEQKVRRETLERERAVSSLGPTPLGMSKSAGSMRHKASIPTEVWEAHDALWPGLSVEQRSEVLRKHVPECFF